MFDVEKIAKTIKEKRIEKNMTQLALADYMGVSYQAVSNWERGNSMPDISKLEDLCKILDVTVEELLGMETSAAETAKKIIENSEEISMEEIAKVAPILPPKILMEKTEKAKSKTERINFEALAEIAEYIEGDYFDEIISEYLDKTDSIKDFEQIFEIIEYLSEDAVIKIIEKTEPKDLDKLADCIEDFGTKALDLFTEKCIKNERFDVISDNAEFFGTETLSAIVDGGIEEGKTSDLFELIEQLSEREVIKIIENADAKDLEKLGEYADEFGTKAIDLFAEKCIENDRFDIISECAYDFSEKTLSLIIDDRIEKKRISDLSEMYEYLSQSQLKRIAKIFIEERNFDELEEIKDYM